MTTQAKLNWAVLYALRHGCFHPVPRPKLTAGTQAWIQWGAMRYLHTAIGEFDRAGGFAEFVPGGVTVGK